MRITFELKPSSVTFCSNKHLKEHQFSKDEIQLMNYDNMRNILKVHGRRYGLNWTPNKAIKQMEELQNSLDDEKTITSDEKETDSTTQASKSNTTKNNNQSQFDDNTDPEYDSDKDAEIESQTGNSSFYSSLPIERLTEEQIAVPSIREMIMSPFELTYFLMYDMRKFELDPDEREKLKPIQKDEPIFNTMYREGNCWIYCLLLTIYDLVCDFIQEYHPFRERNYIAFYFNEYLCNLIMGTDENDLKSVYCSYMEIFED